MDAPPPHALARLIGTMVAGNYELTRVIGVGGMGGVFAAHDEILNREVAVKLILPELVKDAAAVARIRREAVLTAKLRHPGIVEVFAAGHDVDGAFYIVQEFLHGDTLRRVIATETHADTRVLNARMIGILEPMAHVHRANVIHRDIKPDNIIITRDPHTGLERPKIIDLGIGKQLSVALAGNALTANATVIGTIGYMSPEQAKGASDLDARTDVWSLGVTFYEMYAGRWPWTQADNQIAVISSILTDPIPDIREVSRIQISAAVAAAIMRSLKRDPAERFADAGEYLIAMRAAQLPADLGPPVSGEAPTTLSPIRDAPRPVTGSRPRAASWPIAAVVAIATVSAAGIGLRSRGSESTAAPLPGRLPLVPALPDPPVVTPLIAPTPPPAPAAAAIPAIPTIAPVVAPDAPRPTSPARSSSPTQSPFLTPLAPARRSTPAPESEAPATGTLVIRAEPWGHVFVDGRPVGESGTVVTLPAGAHTIRTSGGIDREQTVMVTAGPRRRVIVIEEPHVDRSEIALADAADRAVFDHA